MIICKKTNYNTNNNRKILFIRVIFRKAFPKMIIVTSNRRECYKVNFKITFNINFVEYTTTN